MKESVNTKKQKPSWDEIVKPESRLKVTKLDYMYPIDLGPEWDEYYSIRLDDSDIYSTEDQVRKQAKRLFAITRKAIYAYTHKPEYYPTYMEFRAHATSGNCWTLHKDLLLIFLDWFELEAPLDMLIEKAKRGREERIRRIREQARQTWEEINLTRMIWQSDNAFQVMGLPRNATQEDLKKRYRELAKMHHPDVGGNPEQFKKINAAHKALVQILPLTKDVS